MQSYFIKENARKEEVYAYFVLKNVLFKNKQTVIGDLPQEKTPDISTADKTVGAEVCVCELNSTYLKINNILNGLVGKNGFKQGKFTNNGIRYKRAKNLKSKIFYENESANRLTLKDKSIEYLNRLKEIMLNKLNNLNSGCYNSCKQINLLIISNYQQKNFIKPDTIANMYKKICTNFETKFDNVFLTLNDLLYQISNDGKCVKLVTENEILAQKQELEYSL